MLAWLTNPILPKLMALWKDIQAVPGFDAVEAGVKAALKKHGIDVDAILKLLVCAAAFALCLGVVSPPRATAAGPCVGPLCNVVATSPVARFLGSDFKAAIAKATAIGDVNGLACWTVIEPFASTSPQLPLTFNLASDIENGRALLIAMHKICETPACTQVLQEAANGIGALGVGIAPPSLAGLCAKIPPIAIPAPAK